MGGIINTGAIQIRVRCCLEFRDVYLLAVAAEDENDTVSGTVTTVNGWVDCFGKAELKGTVFAGGVNDIGDILGHPALKKAYELGKTLE